MRRRYYEVRYGIVLTDAEWQRAEHARRVLRPTVRDHVRTAAEILGAILGALLASGLGALLSYYAMYPIAP